MSLKNISFLAFAGTFLVAMLAAVNFFNTITGVVRDIVPAMAILPGLIYLFAAIVVTAFFWLFSRSQV